MSIDIYWRPIDPTERVDLATDTPNSTHEGLERAFGSFPLRLGIEHIERLKGMSAMLPDTTYNPYDDLAQAIREHGRIEVGINDQ